MTYQNRSSSTPSIRSLATLTVLWSTSIASGCSDPDRAERSVETADDTASETEASDVEIDEEALLAELLDYQNRLTKVGEGPETSETHADAAQVEVWATPAARALFDTIDPMDPSQFVEFDRGVTFVKEHFDEDGTMFGINVMFKGPEGYDPEHADWVWLLSRDDEPMQFGKVEFCQDCHSAARNSDFVVGFGKSE